MSQSKARGFVVRTPLLPFAEWLAWSDDLTVAALLPDASDDALAAALAADCTRLRARLAALLDRPVVAEALWLASPSLFQELDRWRRAPESKEGQRIEWALVRYFARMTGRATPFGLFAGLTPGGVADPPGATTRLELAPRDAARRHTQLDRDYLYALAAALERDPALTEALVYHPNSSLHAQAGRWRYVEARLNGPFRSHHLVSVEANPFLEAALARAGAGACRAELAVAVVAADPDGEITLEDAEGFLDELIDGQLLVSNLPPPVTGGDALTELMQRLHEHPGAEGIRGRLGAVAAALRKLDSGLGLAPGRYQAVAAQLADLPAAPQLSRLFQVDFFPRGERVELGAPVLAELAWGAETLARLFGRPSGDPLREFRDAFVERWGELREVPLLQALDEEMGIALAAGGAGGGAEREAAPLLAGLPLGDERPPSARWSAFEAAMLPRLARVWANGEQELELRAADLEALALADAAPLPGTFHVSAVLAASDEAALDAGRFELLLNHASGPSGARMIGRFCSGDAEVHRLVAAHLAAEQAADAEALLAEVVHLPEGRVGNVLCRPLLREWEIPYLGRSGMPAERQIPVSALWVSVANGRVVLRSRHPGPSFGRRIEPRLTTAHNVETQGLAVYRFLCAVQKQHLAHGVMWTWGALGQAPFLPRVTCGRVVFSRARWRVVRAELDALARLDGVARFRAARAWRAERRLPRRVTLVEPDSDHELPLDLDNPLCLDALLERVGPREEVALVEPFPEPTALVARGPEGHFVHELLVPFERLVPPGPRPVETTPQAAAQPVPRTFPPGSDWLYAKLYSSPAGCDRLLREVVAPWFRAAREHDLAQGGFFLRYGDPGWHLRIRFRGEASALTGALLPRFSAALVPFFADGTLSRLQLDTYEREVERYGGPHGIELAERLFEADSEAVLALLDELAGDSGAAARWRLALVGVDQLWTDLGLTLAERLALTGRLRAAFAREIGGGKALQLALDRRYREERPALDAALGGPLPLAFQQRSAALAPVVRELRRAERDGQLTAPVAELAASFAHLHVNRWIRSSARAHERVIYDFLERGYTSRRAREGVKPAG